MSNRTFLVLYRLLYYKHLLLRLSTEERPAALSTYFEAWFAYKEFFDLLLGLDGTTGAFSVFNMAGIDWADSAHLLAQYVYKTYNDTDYDAQVCLAWPVLR